MSYTLGASPAQTADAKGAAIKALQEQFARFESIVTQGAKDVAGDQPTLATNLRAAIPRLRNGMQNVIAGTLKPEPWQSAVNALIEQVRAEAPWYSITSWRSVAEDLGVAAKTVVVETARAAGTAVKAGADAVGVDIQHTLDESVSALKWVGIGAAALGLVYLVAITPKPSRK